MPRPLTFTPEEDAILLNTAGQSAAETNRLLVERGFKPRTADAIKRRRHVLRTQEADDNSITGLLRQRQHLHLRLQVLEAQRATLEAELAKLAIQLKERLDELGEDIDADISVGSA